MLSFDYTIESRCFRLKFTDKPSAAIRSTLKAHGFRWSPSMGQWWRTAVTGAADFIAGLQKQIDDEAGIRRVDAPCWDCKAAEGYFRRYGARTPVYCDACHAKHWEAEYGYLESPRAAAIDVDRMYEDDCARRCGL
jgi:hypothetical protein